MATVINDENYKSLLEEGKPVVIDFWAPWCGPCRSIAPIIEELATAYEGRAIIGKYNVDDDTDLGAVTYYLCHLKCDGSYGIFVKSCLLLPCQCLTGKLQQYSLHIIQPSVKKLEGLTSA